MWASSCWFCMTLVMTSCAADVEVENCTADSGTVDSTLLLQTIDQHLLQTKGRRSDKDVLDGDVALTLSLIEDRNTHAAEVVMAKPLSNTKVDDCFTKETARLKRQGIVAGVGGVLTGGLAGALAGVGQGVKGLIQTGSSSSSSSMLHENSARVVPLMGVVMGVAGVVMPGIQMGHELENTGANNCHQKAAEATLHKLDELDTAVAGVNKTLEQVKQDISNMKTDLTNLIMREADALEQQVDQVLAQGSETHRLMRESETKLTFRMMDLQRGQAQLAAKLDRLSQSVKGNAQQIELASYEQVSMSYSTAIDGISSAHDDFVRLIRLNAKHRKQLTNAIAGGDAASLRSALVGFLQLKQEKREQLQALYVRARTHLSGLAVVLTDGALLERHFKILVANSVREHLSGKNLDGQCKNVLVDLQSGSASELVEAVHQKVIEDQLVYTTVMAVLRASPIADAIMATEPESSETLQGFQTLMADIGNALSQNAERLATDEKGGDAAQLLSDALSAVLPSMCSPSAECLAAEFQAGIIATDQMVLLERVDDVETVVIAPSNLLVDGEASPSIFQECKSHPAWMDATITGYSMGWSKVSWVSHDPQAISGPDWFPLPHNAHITIDQSDLGCHNGVVCQDPREVLCANANEQRTLMCPDGYGFEKVSNNEDVGAQSFKCELLPISSQGGGMTVVKKVQWYTTNSAFHTSGEKHIVEPADFRCKLKQAIAATVSPMDNQSFIDIMDGVVTQSYQLASKNCTSPEDTPLGGCEWVRFSEVLKEANDALVHGQVQAALATEALNTTATAAGKGKAALEAEAQKKREAEIKAEADAKAEQEAKAEALRRQEAEDKAALEADAKAAEEARIAAEAKAAEAAKAAAEARGKAEGKGKAEGNGKRSQSASWRRRRNEGRLIQEEQEKAAREALAAEAAKAAGKGKGGGKGNKVRAGRGRR